MNFLADGAPIAIYGKTWYDYDAPLTRVGFSDDFLPAIFHRRDYPVYLRP